MMTITALLQSPLNSQETQVDIESKQETQHRYTQSMELLVTVVQELSLARDLETITEIVRKAARDLTQADGATFVLKDGDFCHYVDENAISPLWKGKRFPRSICIGGWCMRNRQPAVIPDVEIDERIPIDAYRPTFVKSLLVVPIRAKDPIGAIGNYWANYHVATPEEIKLLQALADTTSVALENVQVYAELEKRVNDRTLELQVANQDLEAFAFTLSHDLRSPLTVLKGFSQLLKLKYMDPLGAEGQRFVSRIEEAAQRIHLQIEGMLLLHQAKRGELEFQSVDLGALAHQILTDLQLSEPNRLVEIAIADKFLEVQGDPVLLRVALENLLSNAWKYSSKKSLTQIEFGRIENSSTFYVKDNGAGFDMADADRLFQPFQRLHEKVEFSGTGIGLASVARIIERHFGKIWAESAPNQGARFFFTLPQDCSIPISKSVDTLSEIAA
jgi:signal transduction histidine kinase